MTESANYKFKKPASTDYYDVSVQNDNWDAADSALKDLDDEKVAANGGDISETKVSAFAADVSQWPIPAAGETPKTLWGKTKKFFEDFKSWMTGVCLLGQLVSNNTTNNSGLPASAAAVYQEAQLRAQQIAQLNSEIGNIFVIPDSTKPDALYNGSASGMYKVNSGTLNNPCGNYGVEIFLKDPSGGWIFVIIIPTSLEAVYFDFYNGYGYNGWIGWRKIDLAKIS